jgi:microcystin degradation protein MlrC
VELQLSHFLLAEQVAQQALLIRKKVLGLRVQGFQPYRSIEGPWARVRFGTVIATFHSQRIGMTTPAHFRVLGIDPSGGAIHVVKLGYLHPQLEDIATGHIMLLSDGATNRNRQFLKEAGGRSSSWPLELLSYAKATVTR